MMTMITVDPGNPHNDQMLAKTREDFTYHMDAILNTLKQGEEKGASLPALMVVIVTGLLTNETETKERLAALLALSLMKNHAYALRDEDSDFAKFVKEIVGR